MTLNRFYEIMSSKNIAQSQLIKHIYFSDEYSFYLKDKVNKQNCRYWTDINPHIIREGHTQYIWAGLLGDTISGPLFFDENLNGESYLEMIDRGKESIIHEVENQKNVDGNLAFDEDLLHLQQDGAPPHYAPDQSPLGFFLWGHLKSGVFKTQPDTTKCA